MTQQTYGEYMRSNPPIPKLTAVEWLMSELEKHLLEYNVKTNLHNTYAYEYSKQMEKEQIMDAWLNGDNDSMYEPKQLQEQAEQYYNETYMKHS